MPLLVYYGKQFSFSVNELQKTEITSSREENVSQIMTVLWLIPLFHF